jgi:hypothetical protein
MSFLDYVNAALDLARKAQSVELERQILAMQSEMNEMQRRNMELDKRVNDLTREHDLIDRRVYEDPSYYVMNPNGSKDGPFCQPCWDSKGTVIRTRDHDIYGGRERVCHVCGTKMIVSRHSEPDPNAGFRGGWT